MTSKYKKRNFMQYTTISINTKIDELLQEFQAKTHLRKSDIIWLAIENFKENNISEEDMLIFREIYPIPNVDTKHNTHILKNSYYALKKIKGQYKVKIFLYQLLWIILTCYKYRKELFTTELSEQALNHYNNMKKFMNTVNNFTEEGHKNETK